VALAFGRLPDRPAFGRAVGDRCRRHHRSADQPRPAAGTTQVGRRSRRQRV